MSNHNLAMNLSFKAKQKVESGEIEEAYRLYDEAAKIESELAEFYKNDPSLEPTRSIIIRSATFLNLKAGNISEAEKLAFWGMVNLTNSDIKDQLYNAVEICVSMKDYKTKDLSSNAEYIFRLRQSSIDYIIEPKDKIYSNATTVEMASEFFSNYLRSFKAYSKIQYKKHFSSSYTSDESCDQAASKFGELITPIITSSSYGSFKFSIATDVLQRPGESRELTALKSTVLNKFHNEVFSKELTDSSISQLKESFSSSEIDQIFRPLFVIRANNSDFSVSYIDRDKMKKVQISSSKNSDRVKLLTIKQINKEDIGVLEYILTHNRKTNQETSSKKVILKQELKALTFDHPEEIISPDNHPSIILNRTIIINVNFNSEIGFTLGYDELDLIVTETTFDACVQAFHNKFYSKLKSLWGKETRTPSEERMYMHYNELINNVGALL